MKSFNFKQLACVLLALAVSTSAFAAPRDTKKTAEPSDVHPVPAVTSSSGGFGIGYASTLIFTGAASSVTGLIKINETNAIQVFLSIPTTSPFEFTAGGNYKYTVSGGSSAGFHVGGGFTLGSLSVGRGNGFALAVGPTAGIHFALPSVSRVQFHFDGGPVFSTVDGNSNFVLGSHSALLGASIIYMF